MAEIAIPFTPQMAWCIVSENKTCTTRTKKYGNPGDTFRVTYDGVSVTCELVAIEKVRLIDVAENHYEAEGFPTQWDFIAFWNKIHPRHGFGFGLRDVFLHKFVLKGVR